MQFECPRSALLTHSAGGVAEGGRLFGFHIKTLYYKRLQLSSLAYLSPSPATPDGVCHTRKQPGGRHLQRVIQDPIPFLILFGSILLMLWLWRRFRDR
jgi:hypothetical protein